jgi:hypothetical protein
MGKRENKRKTDRLYSFKPTLVYLKGKGYRLNDIATEGIGIIVDGPHIFFSGQRFDNITLQLNEGPISLKGIVTHITKNEINTVCGVRFILAGIEEYKSAERFKNERAL